MTRVAVFIDCENTRFGAREVFGDPQRDPYTFGHVKPLRLALLLKQLGEKVDPARELTAVYVYRGRPGPKSGSRAQAGSARQFDEWESQPLVSVRSRPLRYQPTAWSLGKPTAWRAEEKGIDVLTALDIAIGARDDNYDIAVVMSADSDLAPAIEVAFDAGKRVETAMWWSPDHPHRRMRVPVTGPRFWSRCCESVFGLFCARWSAYSAGVGMPGAECGR
ncbi:MAG: NYN domain-containing protein [bacterium]|nr:NYN domain-containing protein [bacterium]